MTRRLLTPTGPIDVTDADPRLVDIIASLATKLADEKKLRRRAASDARKYEIQLNAARADLDALRAEVEGTDAGQLKKDLRAETKRADRLERKVAASAEERRERTVERKKLTDRLRELQKSNDNYRQRLETMKVDLERARSTTTIRQGGPSALSDLQIATVLLSDLHDRLTSQARRTSSSAVGSALRLAAREVARTKHELADRGGNEVAA